MESKSAFRPHPDLKLMDQVREVLRYHHYAYRTEQSYCQWIIRYIRFHNNVHPKELSSTHIERFLSDLSVNKSVSASTQNQAFNSLLFLYNKVLFLPLDGKIQAIRSSKKTKIPTVLSKDETQSFFMHINGAHARKYKNASKEIQWQYVFPAKKRSIDPRSGAERKHHVMESGL